MKKYIYSILLSLFILLPISALAEGYVSVSPSTITVEQGSSKTFTITAFNAIGDVSIISNNTNIALVSSNEWGTGMVDERQTKTGTITVTGVSEGATTITLNIDAATFDSEDLSGQTKSITVNVIKKATQTPSQTPTHIPSNPNTNNNINSNNLSQNNKIKSLSVEGYDLLKIDDNNYILDVANDINKVNVNAEAEDNKSKITGIGIHELNVGENNIEIIVTSEAGIQNKINLKVTRKDAYYLEDFEYLVNKKEQEQINISIDYDTNITEEQVNKIQKNSKIVNLNYYDENKKLVYSWTLDGKQIKDVKNLETSISFITDNKKEIYKLSNYADGLYINFKHTGELPFGTKIKLFVGDKFEDGSIVNVYHYDKTKKELVFIKDNLKVENGYVEFDIKHCSEYFITMSTLPTQVKENTIPKEKKSSINIIIIIGIVIFISLITFVILYCSKKKSTKSENTQINDINNENISINENLEKIEQENNNVEKLHSLDIVNNNQINTFNNNLIYNKKEENVRKINEPIFNTIKEKELEEEQINTNAFNYSLNNEYEYNRFENKYNNEMLNNFDNNKEEDLITHKNEDIISNFNSEQSFNNIDNNFNFLSNVENENKIEEKLKTPEFNYSLNNEYEYNRFEDKYNKELLNNFDNNKEEDLITHKNEDIISNFNSEQSFNNIDNSYSFNYNSSSNFERENNSLNEYNKTNIKNNSEYMDEEDNIYVNIDLFND